MTGFALVWVLFLGKGEEKDFILELFSNLNSCTRNEAYPWQSWTFTPVGCMEAHNAWKQNAISKTKDRSNWRNSFHITKPQVKVVIHPTAQVTDTISQKGISKFSITSDSFFTKGNKLYFNFWVDGWEQIIKWTLQLQTSIVHKKKQLKMQLASSQSIPPLFSDRVKDEICLLSPERIRTDCLFSKFKKSPLGESWTTEKQSNTWKKMTKANLQ